jgi:hypothetical protein
VAAALQQAGTTAGKNDRDVVRVMAVAVGNAGAIHHRHVIEQRAVSVGRRLQALEVIRELLDVIRVDLRDLLDLRQLSGIVRDRMMRIGHADLRVGHAAVLATHHEGDDARQIALIGQHLQVDHQPHVRFPVGGNAAG